MRMKKIVNGNRNNANYEKTINTDKFKQYDDV